MVTAVLFDLEGTLVQTPWEDFEHVLEFRRETRRKLVELGIPSRVLEGVELSTLMRNMAVEHVDTNFSNAEARRFHQEMESFLKRYELDAARKSKLFAETTSTLTELRRLGTKNGLVTNTSREAVNTVFQMHDLERYFDVIITRESVKKMKPDPEGILHAIKRLAAKVFFMVGDSVHDVLAAKGAGGTSIIVKRDAARSLNPSPEYLVQSLNEIPSIIQNAMANSSPSR